MKFEAFRLEDWDVIVYWLPYFLVLCGAAALLSILVLALMCRTLRLLRWRLAAVCAELERVERALRDLPPRHTAFDEFVQREKAEEEEDEDDFIDEDDDWDEDADVNDALMPASDDRKLEAYWHDLQAPRDLRTKLDEGRR